MTRLAIISSPRSGNSWTRSVIAKGLRIPELAVHDYADLQALPDRCVVQVHWYREPHFQRFLASERFAVLTLARHPLDVLLSVLHFVQHEPETSKWLLGNCEIPAALQHHGPTSDTFLDYCLSWGAENLLSITYQWWHDKDAIKARYEDLVRQPADGFAGIAAALGESADRLSEALAQRNLEHFQATPNKHGWRGIPNHWQTMIPRSFADQIRDRHARVFDCLGYTVPDYELDADEARETWAKLRIRPTTT
ncbi:MAG: sulfotransferase domain-containing protein [Hyphomicrobiaceae bacterium]|nr:sulfotransferase domain-containing protein [Hyphomicrobiaceae bacterium]